MALLLFSRSFITDRNNSAFKCCVVLECTSKRANYSNRGEFNEINTVRVVGKYLKLVGYFWEFLGIIGTAGNCMF